MLLSLLVAACAPAAPPVLLDTAGGDAWTFEKRVAATVAPGACEQVSFASAVGIVQAEPREGRVAARVPLAPGPNVVEAVCQGDGSRGAPARQSWNVRLADAPKAWVRTVASGSGVALDAGGTRLAPVRPAPLVAYHWRARAGNPAPLRGLPAEGERIALPAPPVDGEYYITLRVTDALGRSDESTAVFRVRDGRAEEVDLARDNPGWVDRAVVYGVVPFFFGPNGFDDVTSRVDELADLGVTTLWLSPITAAPPEDFGYAVTDHFALRTRFGSEADLRELIAAAHDAGLRVIIDFIPNHVSAEHAYYQDAEARGPASAYYDFFERAEGGEAAFYFDWPHLINLDFDDPEVQRMVIEAFAHWVKTYDVDGFRVDVAWGPRERAPEFWPRWRAELKRIEPDLFLLAEAPARDPYYFLHGFDAAYDWTETLGEWAWRAAFDDRAHTARRLRAAIGSDGAGLHPDALVLRFLNNNDTGARFVTRYGLPRTRVAAAMLLTLPGIPALYTGDEVGAAFQPYDEGPPVEWVDRYGLTQWYDRLIALRQAQPALRSREIELLDLAPADRLLAYLRPADRPEDAVLVLLNYGETPLEVVLPREVARSVAPGGRARDLLAGDILAVQENSPIPLPGYGVRILQAD